MKKALSLLLAIVMVISLLPMAAFAAEAGGKITFTTTFKDGMTVGETFTVTATLSENPGIASFAHQLTWNDKVLKFAGFANDPDDEDYKYTEVMAKGWVVVTNDDTGYFTASVESNKTKNGDLYTAKFEIIAGGDLGLGLDAEETVFADELGKDYEAILDMSAISGLKAAGASAAPEMPADAPFTDITTDAGNILSIEYVEDMEFNGGYVPYYVVTIPADATTAYVTAPDQVVMEDWNTGAMQATGYAANLEEMSIPMYISYDYEDTADGPKVEIPLIMTASDMSGGEVEMYFVGDEYNNATHAFGIEDAGYACLGLISFAYGEAEEEEAETYAINYDNIVGGTVTAMNENYEPITQAKEGDIIYLNIAADEGYAAKTWGYVFGGTFYHCENGAFNMPAGEVTLTATFEATHTCTYDRETVDAKYLKEEATCQSGAVYYKSCACGEFATTADTFVSGNAVDHVYVDGVCKWCSAAEPVLTTGYSFATSADVSAENGCTAAVHVKITGHSNPEITTYNAYDLTLTFDSSKLELVDYAGAVRNDGGSVTVNGSEIRIVGCGEDKSFGTEIATLTFKTKAEGAANVTISRVQVSDKNESIKADAPEASAEHAEDDTNADETPDVSIVVVPYSVTKPGFISGSDKVLEGESYSFSYTDTTNYTYSGLTVTVGGEAVEADEKDGVYTIANVNGAVVITATQTANSYTVTKPGNVSGPEKATYGQDYIFTVTASENKIIESVTVTLADGGNVDYTHNAETGEYTIAGSKISGAFTIAVTEVDDRKMTTVHFQGITSGEIEGGQLSVPAEVGKDFSFKLIKDSENYTYTVMVGGTELEEKDGTYIISGNLVILAGVTVTIEKTEIKKLAVDVTEYFNVDGKTMFLVTAKWGDKVLAWGNDTMFYSGRYEVSGYEAGAYCWLVLSTDEMNTADKVKTAAEAVIVEAAEGAAATDIAYDYDVNKTTVADVNDAQLVYDMYNAHYMSFSEDLPMRKFLEADVQTDMELTTQDVATIINVIVSGVMPA